jgi:aminoglycoside phosphotransferase (APT) family kinase protein
MAREAAAIAVAGRAGVAVPQLVDSGIDPAVLGAPYLISEHVDGETIARRLLRDPQYADARAGLAAELGRTLARIHSIPVGAVSGLTAAVRAAVTDRLTAANPITCPTPPERGRKQIARDVDPAGPRL